MRVVTDRHQYQCGEVSLSAFVAWDEDVATPSSPVPGVLVAHTAIGPQDAFIESKVVALAEMGYVAFSLDMFGAGRAVVEPEEKMRAIEPLKKDRTLMIKRAIAAVDDVSKLAVVDSSRLAAIGYCLGGQTVLDLARAGLDNILGVVSFHGILDCPTLPDYPSFKAKVLACHGNRDPFISSSDLDAFTQEMEEKDVDWQLHVYGGAYHAFTRPEKVGEEHKQAGFQYDRNADTRSWKTMTNFLQEVMRA